MVVWSERAGTWLGRGSVCSHSPLQSRWLWSSADVAVLMWLVSLGTSLAWTVMSSFQVTKTPSLAAVKAAVVLLHFLLL